MQKKKGRGVSEERKNMALHLAWGTGHGACGLQHAARGRQQAARELPE